MRRPYRPWGFCLARYPGRWPGLVCCGPLALEEGMDGFRRFSLDATLSGLVVVGGFNPGSSSARNPGLLAKLLGGGDLFIK
jgi:hypothetical protein